MNNQWQEEFRKKIGSPKNTGYRISQEYIGSVFNFIEELLDEERKRITSIVQKEIAKSDKYQIEALEKIRYNINNE